MRIVSWILINLFDSMYAPHFTLIFNENSVLVKSVPYLPLFKHTCHPFCHICYIWVYSACSTIHLNVKGINCFIVPDSDECGIAKLLLSFIKLLPAKVLFICKGSTNRFVQIPHNSYRSTSQLPLLPQRRVNYHSQIWFEKQKQV
jgi:hypothetical protein